VTVSAGVATFVSGSDIASAEQLVAAADRALYAAKRAGKNRVVVHQS
jgi:PleD family two-component response regulator